MEATAQGPVAGKSAPDLVDNTRLSTVVTHMTSTSSVAPLSSADATQSDSPSDNPRGPRPIQAALEKLFELYPHLFGAEFLPLKLGTFQELLARHPEHFERALLKAALGVHTRSTRYLQSVAAGKMRHDLQGQAVEKVAPEHIHWAQFELFRRRQARSKEDLSPKLRQQWMATFEASGLTRQEYREKVHSGDAQAGALLEEAFAELDQKLARQEALIRTFNDSGKTIDEFVAMYGLDKRDLNRALAASRSRNAPSVARAD